jgi:hypothetical protein
MVPSLNRLTEDQARGYFYSLPSGRTEAKKDGGVVLITFRNEVVISVSTGPRPHVTGSRKFQSLDLRHRAQTIDFSRFYVAGSSPAPLTGESERYSLPLLRSRRRKGKAGTVYRAFTGESQVPPPKNRWDRFPLR